MFKDGSMSCFSTISAAVTTGLWYHTDSVPYLHSAWTTFDQREHSESHASVIRDDKTASSNSRQLRLNQQTMFKILRLPVFCVNSPWNQVTVNLLMTDEDKNVKNRIVVGNYTSTAVFLTSLNYRSLCAFFFSPPFSSKVYCGAEKSSRLWKGLAPVNHLLQ